MILRSIGVAQWRSFLEPVTVGPFGEGLNVIHAPNGTGKSTLFEALRLGLLDRHRTSGAEMKALAPWGRALSPRVSVEFVQDGTTYRITKQFLTGASATLERMEEQRYRPFAEGDAADEAVRAMLAGSTPGRGLSGPQHWGLAQVLWAPQGRMALGTLSADLDSELRRVIAGQLTDQAAAPLEQRIEAAYNALYTPGGALRSGQNAAPPVLLRQALDAARAELAEAQQQYAAFEDQSRRVEDARAANAHARRLAADAEEALRAAAAQATAWRQLDSERQRFAAEVAATESRVVTLTQQRDALAALAREITSTQEALAALEAASPERDRELQVRQQAAAKAQAHLEDTRRGRTAVDAAERAVVAATSYQTTRAESTRLSSRLASLALVTAELAAKRAERDPVIAPTPKELRQLREALRQRDEARLQIEAASIEVEWVPVSDGEVVVLEGAAPGVHPVRAAIPVTFRGIPRVALEIPGQGRLRASGPVSDVAALQADLTRAEAQLEAFLARLGSVDLEALGQRREMADALDQAIAQAQTRYDTLLGDEESEAVLRHALEQANARLGAALTHYPAWTDAPPDVGALEAAARTLRSAYDAALHAAEADWSRTDAARASAQQEADTHARRVEETRARRARLAQQQADAEKSLPDPAVRAQTLQEAALAWEAARARLQDAESRMPAGSAGVETDLARLEAAYRGLDDAAAQARDKEQGALALLEQLAGKGTYSKLVALEEQVAVLEEDLARAQRHADAIRRLRETVEGCRGELRAQVYGPVEARASELLTRIAGRKLGPVALGDAFSPTGVRPPQAETEVALGALSGGEQEQLQLAVRLSLARELSKQDRHLVVLDDVLTATDTARLRRIHALLEEAAAQLQVVVLTCHPELYRGMNATWFDLEALLLDTAQQ
jgi:hypothetical protein